MKKTALVTGASKGIGYELAYIFAENGADLVLVARNANELENIKNDLEKKYNVAVYIIVKDLSQTGSAQEIFDELKDKQIDIDYLVNNAGFGDYGNFSETDWERYEKMIGLNAVALTHLCHLYAKDWSGRKSAKILNVCSTSAFQPGPKMAVYFATKSFVLSLSEAIGYELKEKNITVTTLCPGPTNTSFGLEAGISAQDLVKGVKSADARDVALMGYSAMMKGKSTVIHGGLNKAVAFGVRFLPRRWVTMIAGKILS